MKIIYSIVFTVLANFTFAQKQGNNWYFGEEAAVTFNSGKPVAIGKSGMSATYGCASISSKTGKLLFYSNGNDVWDSTNRIMPNGSKLKGNHFFSVQSALIVPWPDSSHLYYIFTPPTFAPTSKGYDTVLYSIINMKLNSGLGDVVNGKKNIVLKNNLSSGKINAVSHANRKDFWVVTPKGNSDTIFAYLLTSSGISNTPVISRTGYKLKQSRYTDTTLGYFKLSPDGKKLCNINWLDSSIIADFDASTGKISNVWGFKLNYNNGIGLEFSAKSKFLYIFDYAMNRLSQFDLSAKTKSDFLASRTTADSGNVATGARIGFQLATDGKIYFSEGTNNYLHVLHAPDSIGKNARFQRNYLPLWGLSHCFVGLPDMVQSFFQKRTFDVKPNCARDTVFFNISNTYNLDSARWDFGDTSSGIHNFSTKTSNVFHLYKKVGNYTIRLISYHKQFIDTIYETFYLNYGKPFLGNDLTRCNTFKLNLSPVGNYKSYLWNGGITTKSLQVNKSGTYSLKVTDYDGCLNSDTIIIANPIVTAKFVIKDTGQCFKSHSMNLSDISFIKGGIRKRSTWIITDGSRVVDSSFIKTFSSSGRYKITLISESTAGCLDSITQNITIYPNTSVGFTINNPSQCLNTNSFNFVNSSTNVSDSLSFEWDLGDIKTTQPDFIGKKYSQTGNFMISLISISENNCKDTITKSISILPSPKAEFFWGGACSRKNIQFTFAGNVPALPVTTNYKWYFPNKDSSDLKNPSKLLNQPGINNVTLVTKSDNGCESSITRDVEVLPQAKADFETKDVCEDSAVFFNNTSQDGITYSWKFGDGKSSNLKSPQHQYSIAGISRSFNVNLIAFVPGGCSDSITKAVTVNANPNSDFTFSISGRLVNFTASELSATQYKWNFGDGSTFNSTTPQTSYHYTKFPFGKYPTCLTVTNVANCISETCKEVNITGAVNNISIQSGINVYPNPNTGNFTIDIHEQKGKISFEIFNHLGEVVHKAELNQALTTFNLNLAQGLYLVRVLKGENLFIQKLIIQK